MDLFSLNRLFRPEQNGGERLATLIDGAHPLRLRLNGNGYAVFEGGCPNRSQFVTTSSFSLFVNWNMKSRGKRSRCGGKGRKNGPFTRIKSDNFGYKSDKPT